MKSAIVHRVLGVGPFQSNCHIVADERTREAVVIDPGDEPERILDEVKDLGARVLALVHTHGHLDHIAGTRGVKEETGARILIHRADRKLYENLQGQFLSTIRMFGAVLGPVEDPLPVDEFLEEDRPVPFGGFELRVLHTPGHTPGSCSFLLEDGRTKRVFCGDTLFAGSIGRTDLPGGDLEAEIRSIRGRLFPLGEDTLVLTGHGPQTTIGEEKASNPFLR